MNDKLSLSERSYLAEIISKYFPTEQNSYEIASNFTRQQRGKFLKHYFEHQDGEAKDMIEQIKSFQTTLIK